MLLISLIYLCINFQVQNVVNHLFNNIKKVMFLKRLYFTIKINSIGCEFKKIFLNFIYGIDLLKKVFNSKIKFSVLTEKLKHKITQKKPRIILFC